MLYGFFFFTFGVSVTGAIFYGMIKEFENEFSLNPGWDSTRDFIDAIPTYRGKKK